MGTFLGGKHLPQCAGTFWWFTLGWSSHSLSDCGEGELALLKANLAFGSSCQKPEPQKVQRQAKEPPQETGMWNQCYIKNWTTLYSNLKCLRFSSILKIVLDFPLICIKNTIITMTFTLYIWWDNFQVQVSQYISSKHVLLGSIFWKRTGGKKTWTQWKWGKIVL